MSGTYVHPTAEVHSSAIVGDGTQVWNWTKIREHARIGAGCRVGQGVYVDIGVHIGDRCKIQNGVSVFQGVTVGHDVFIGPEVSFTNDRVPRANRTDWEVIATTVEDHASLGANATIVCGVTLGRACMIGAGSVVTADVPSHALVVGNPARIIDYVTLDGSRLHMDPGTPPPAHALERGDA